LSCYKRGLNAGKIHQSYNNPAEGVAYLAEHLHDPRWVAAKSYEWGVAGTFAYATYKTQKVKMARPQNSFPHYER